MGKAENDRAENVWNSLYKYYKKTLMQSIKYAAKIVLMSIVLLEKFWWTRGPWAILAHLSKQLQKLKFAF